MHHFRWIEPLRVCRRLQLLSRMEHHEQDNGGRYEKGADWSSFVVIDGNLVIGQTPASSEEAAQKLLKLL